MVNINDILGIIKDQAGKKGIVEVSDILISMIAGCSVRTVQRSLIKLEEDKLIERQSRKLRTVNGHIMTKRDIVITDPNAPYKGFTVQQHRNLSLKRNHRIIGYRDDNGYLTGVEWFRRPDGHKGEWELNLPDKQFYTFKKAYEYRNYAIRLHKQYIDTGKYTLI